MANDAGKPLSKNELFGAIAEKTGLSKKDVAAVFDAFRDEIANAVSAKGPGMIQLPGLLKILRHYRPATKKKQVRNPATGEMVWSGPKPATNVVKVRALKALKSMV
jgi:nucleoid DNA-binding protein